MLYFNLKFGTLLAIFGQLVVEGTWALQCWCQKVQLLLQRC